MSKVVAWLESRFAVLEVPASRNAVSFSSTAALVTAAFLTEIHRYVLNGEEHYANSGEPSVPAALGGVVSGLTGLNDFRRSSRPALPIPQSRLGDDFAGAAGVWRDSGDRQHQWNEPYRGNFAEGELDHARAHSF